MVKIHKITCFGAKIAETLMFSNSPSGRLIYWSPLVPREHDFQRKWKGHQELWSRFDSVFIDYFSNNFSFALDLLALPPPTRQACQLFIPRSPRFCGLSKIRDPRKPGLVSSKLSQDVCCYPRKNLIFELRCFQTIFLLSDHSWGSFSASEWQKDAFCRRDWDILTWPCSYE